MIAVVLALLVLMVSYKVGNAWSAGEDAVGEHPLRNSSTTATRTGKNVGSDARWSALDEHQLTRLLTQAARRPPTEITDRRGTDDRPRRR